MFLPRQVKVKVVTKVTVEDVELSVVDKEQNIKSKTVRWLMQFNVLILSQFRVKELQWLENIYLL